MRKYIALIMVFTIFSCGNKTVKTDGIALKTTDEYVTKIDTNLNLIEEFTEGTLTDNNGFKTIGQFKHLVLFDKYSRELFRIINIEISDITVEERYYFHNHNLVYIISSTSGEPDKKIYTQGFKDVVSSSQVTEDEEKLLLNKAKRFKNNHYRILD